ncbi:MAG: hypothetical protein JJW01_00110 [Alphaproteobacteria bacterium]|nr:hypothetical protein [Rickettsiales bacterium]
MSRRLGLSEYGLVECICVINELNNRIKKGDLKFKETFYFFGKFSSCLDEKNNNQKVGKINVGAGFVDVLSGCMAGVYKKRLYGSVKKCVAVAKSSVRHSNVNFQSNNISCNLSSCGGILLDEDVVCKL